MLSFFQDKILAAARPEGEEGGLGLEVTLRRRERRVPQVESAGSEAHRGGIDPDDPGNTISTWVTPQGRSAASEGPASLHRKAGPRPPETLTCMNNLASSYDHGPPSPRPSS